MENDIPTALEFFIKQKTYTNIEQFMIEFAKLHVEAALNAACTSDGYEIDEESILNAYPLTNIK